MIVADFMVWPLCLVAMGTAVLLGTCIYKGGRREGRTDGRSTSVQWTDITSNVYSMSPIITL